ncbi:MAG: hypothetical protein LLG04_15205 [Parachlamydia sp.]|nr:hypothetical protein [Parachlamydia sp.]
MQPAPSLTPCQKLQQAWLEYNVATLEDKNQKQNEMIKLLKEEILGFSGRDVAALQELANEVSNNPQLDPTLVTKITELAEMLTDFSLGNLPNEFMVDALSFISPLRSNGMNRSCKMWAEEAARNRPRVVNDPNEPIPLDRLLLLLAQCGDSVEHLDFSRLLTEVDRKKLDAAQLENMVRFCPNLQSLTLLQIDNVQGQQLCHIVNLAPGLTHLNVVGCLGMMDRDTLQGVRESCPQLAIGFVPYQDKYPLLELLHNGVRLRNYFALDKEKKAFITSNLQALGTLSRYGFPFELFCQISQKKRELLVAKSEYIHRLNEIAGFNFEAFAKLSTEEMVLIFDHLYEVSHLSYAGLKFLHFCEVSLKTKQMLVEKNVFQAVRKLLQNLVPLKKFLALPLDLRELVVDKYERVIDLLFAGCSWEQFVGLRVQHRLELLAHSSDCFNLKQQNITPHRLSLLDLPLLRMVLSNSMALATLLSVKMDFEAFCALPPADKKCVIANVQPYTVFLMGGARIETLVRLTDDEISYFFPNNFHCLYLHGRIGIPLARFVELQAPLRQKVMQHSTTIANKIRSGSLNFEEFLKMSEEEQDKILKP